VVLVVFKLFHEVRFYGLHFNPGSGQKVWLLAGKLVHFWTVNPPLANGREKGLVSNNLIISHFCFGIDLENHLGDDKTSTALKIKAT
jgi:hypothetical protein